jgi:hypothetical protein
MALERLDQGMVSRQLAEGRCRFKDSNGLRFQRRKQLEERTENNIKNESTPFGI